MSSITTRVIILVFNVTVFAHSNRCREFQFSKNNQYNFGAERKKHRYLQKHENFYLRAAKHWFSKYWYHEIHSIYKYIYYFIGKNLAFCNKISFLTILFVFSFFLFNDREAQTIILMHNVRYYMETNLHFYKNIKYHIFPWNTEQIYSNI